METKLPIEVEEVYHNLDIDYKILNVISGPMVTTYELESSLSGEDFYKACNRLARALYDQIRIKAFDDPERWFLEIPNKKTECIFISDLLKDKKFIDNENILNIALGKDTSGKNVYIDFDKTANWIICGEDEIEMQMCLHSIILSLLYRMSPEQCKLVLMSNEYSDLSIYKDVPHSFNLRCTPAYSSYTPYIKMAFDELEEELHKRYDALEKTGVDNIHRYNKKVKNLKQARQDIDLETMPFIFIIIKDSRERDERILSSFDYNKDIWPVLRLGRTVGIYVVLASYDLENIWPYKEFFSTRIAYHMNRINSRSFLNNPEASKLLEESDMLMYSVPTDDITRIHGCQIDTEEIDILLKEIEAKYKPKSE